MGCAVYHLATFEPPFQDENLIILGNNIVHRKQRAISNCFSLRLNSFIDTLLAKKSGDRPTAKDALKLIPSFIRKAYHEEIHPGEKAVEDKEGDLNLLPVGDKLDFDKPIITNPETREDLFSSDKRTKLDKIEEVKEDHPESARKDGYPSTQVRIFNTPVGSIVKD